MKTNHTPFRQQIISTAALTAVLMSSLPARGDDNDREHQVEAAFIYNFTQFIAWPSNAFPNDSAPFVVGVFGDDPFNGMLTRMMAGKHVGSHAVQVQFLHSPSDVSRVQLLYVPSSEDDQMSDIATQLNDAPVLTIGQSEAFLASSGGIRLYTEDRRMRFEVNLHATDHARLKISSKLLNLAKIYDE